MHKGGAMSYFFCKISPGLVRSYLPGCVPKEGFCLFSFFPPVIAHRPAPRFARRRPARSPCLCSTSLPLCVPNVSAFSPRLCPCVSLNYLPRPHFLTPHYYTEVSSFSRPICPCVSIKKVSACSRPTCREAGHARKPSGKKNIT